MQNKDNKTSDIKEYRRQYRKNNKEKIKAYRIKNRKPKAKTNESIKDPLNFRFTYGQYWLIEYNEIKPNGLSFKFKTFIFSRSADIAKTILFKKTKEDSPSSKIKIVKIAMLHKNFKFSRKKITVRDWLDIRNCCFPNNLNILFKHHDGQ